MKMFIKFLLISILLLTISGCFGSKELNDIGIVAATGIDIDPEGKVRITVLTVIPAGKNTNASEKSTEWIGTSTGSNLMEASRNLRSTAFKKPIWFHNRLIIIGEETARLGLKNVLDFLSRNREMRYSSKILISEGRAEDILQVPADIQKYLSLEIEGLIKSTDEWSGTYVSNLKDFMIAILQKDRESVTGRLGYYETKRNTFSTTKEEYEKLYWKDSKIGNVFLSGSAVFKSDKMKGWMDSKETRGYMFINGKVKTGSVTVKGVDERGELVIDILGSKSKISPVMVDGKISMIVKVDVQGALSQQVDGKELEDESDIEKAEKSVAEAISDEMKQSVKKAQEEYNSDIFGFGESVKRKYPGIWKKIEKDWNDIFPTMEVGYEVKVKIKRTGMAKSNFQDTTK